AGAGGAPPPLLDIHLGTAVGVVFKMEVAGGCRSDTPPIRFVRSKGMLPLPIPTRNGSIKSLATFINIKSDADFVLVVSWLLAALRDHGPYPVLVVIGEQGSAKSTLMEILRNIIDPNVACLRAPPKDEEDLYITATLSHVLAWVLSDPDFRRSKRD